MSILAILLSVRNVLAYPPATPERSDGGQASTIMQTPPEYYCKFSLKKLFTLVSMSRGGSLWEPFSGK
jgi:hypothetical protein